MLAIVNGSNGRRTDYSRSYLATEARHAVRGLPDSDNKVRAWSIEVSEMAGAAACRLRIDYLSRDGNPRVHYVVL